MLQLLGFWTVEFLDNDTKHVNLRIMNQALEQTRMDFFNSVLLATFNELSKGNITFLAAMNTK